MVRMCDEKLVRYRIDEMCCVGIPWRVLSVY